MSTPIFEYNEKQSIKKTNVANHTNNFRMNDTKQEKQQFRNRKTYGLAIFSSKKNIAWATAVFIAFSSLSSSITVFSASVHTKENFITEPKFEPLCSVKQEQFIESDGVDSSVILEFNSKKSPLELKKSCARILSAPPSYDFIVRLMLPKLKHDHHHAENTPSHTDADEPNNSGTQSSNMSKKSQDAAPIVVLKKMSALIEQLNSTIQKPVMNRSCPLSIFSSLDPHTAQWRVDPCQIEDTAPDMEDPVRLFHGRIRIIWEHGRNILNSKLMVTALGKGNQCRNKNKHQCLSIGDEPILCISKDLVCDGIRHCPYSPEYDSDEKYSMCWKKRHSNEPTPPVLESDIFEHFAMEVFRNLFAVDGPIPPNPHNNTAFSVNVGENNTSLAKNYNDTSNINGTSALETTPSVNNFENTNVTTSHHHRRNSTRFGLNSDLSKYGPWGYLMLGMLLCGGALLICGLWASASQHAVNNEREAALQNSIINENSTDHQNISAPPMYEELEPPPAYSMLFPNQKGASDTTFNLTPPGAITSAAVTSQTTTSSIILCEVMETNGTSPEANTASSSNYSQLLN